MPYMIATYDKPGHEHVRDATRAEHLKFLEANVEKVIAGGGFWNDDESSVIGGLILLDVDSRADAEEFISRDPFFSAELFDRIEFVRWRPSFLDYKRVFPPASKL